MPPERRDPGDPREWLRRARSNLARARAHAGLPDVLYEDCCFDAQQAVEKAIKAVLVGRSVRFPRTHAIAELLTRAAEAGFVVPTEVAEAARLTRYAVRARYPASAEDVTAEEHAEAVALAERVLSWAERLIEGG